MKKDKIRNFELKTLSNSALQCATCGANFEVWLGNQRLSENREEKMRSHFLQYCPDCSKADEKSL